MLFDREEDFLSHLLKMLCQRTKQDKVRIHMQHIDRLGGFALEICKTGLSDVLYVAPCRAGFKKTEQDYLISIDGTKADYVVKAPHRNYREQLIVGIPDLVDMTFDIVSVINKRFYMNCEV